MSSWLEPLIDPGALIRSAHDEQTLDVRVGLALLLEARLLVYRSLAADNGWPGIGETAPRGAPLAHRLLCAVTLQFTGDERAEAAYRGVMRARDSSLLTTATVLFAVYLRDIGRGQEAVRLLRRRAGSASDAVERMLLQLHLGARFAEVDDWHGAASATEAAIDTANARPGDRWAMALRIVAEHNLFQFRWRQGFIPVEPLSLPPRTNDPLLLRTELITAGALPKYLERQFDAALADPYTQTVSFQAEDATERGLQGALLRAEWLADWQSLNQARKLLGRYLVLSRLGTSQSVPPNALELLRHAGDTSGLRASARTVARIGPLAPLQQATAALVARRTLDEEPAASLVLLAEGADLLTRDDADRCLEELMRSRKLVLAAWQEFARTMAELLPVASDELQTRSARFMRELIETENNAGLIHSFQRPVAALRWEAVNVGERLEWLRFGQRNFGTATDLHIIAVRVLLALAEVEREQIDAFLRERLFDSPTLETIALAIDASFQIPNSIVRTVTNVVFSAMRKVRDDAKEGRYSLGLVDVGRLAVSVLVPHPRLIEGWDEVLQFILDPRVGIAAKTGPLNVLSAGDIRMPREIRERLRKALPTLAASDPFLASPESFIAAKLRLGATLNAYPREELLAGVLELTTGPAALGRIEGAATLPLAQRRVGYDTAATVALTLSHDLNHDVRAAAARALPQLRASNGDSVMAAMKRRRLGELLGDQGTVVPCGVLIGLTHAARAGSPIAAEFRDDAERLLRLHPSHLVRSAAGALIEALSGAQKPLPTRPPKPLPKKIQPRP